MLITDAPAAIALAIAAPDAAQLVSPSVPAVVRSGPFRASAPGHTPRMPMPLAGAAATAAVAVPCRLSTGVPGIVVKFGSPVHSGCVTSAAASTRAMSGLCGDTTGGVGDGSATCARQALGGPDKGSLAPCLVCSSTFGWAYASRPP